MERRARLLLGSRTSSRSASASALGSSPLESAAANARSRNRDFEDRLGGPPGSRLPPPECPDRRWRSRPTDNCRAGCRRSPVFPIRGRSRKLRPRRRRQRLTGPRPGKGLPAASKPSIGFAYLALSHVCQSANNGVEHAAQDAALPSSRNHTRILPEPLLAAESGDFAPQLKDPDNSVRPRLPAESI